VQKIRVLVADDNEAVRENLSRLLDLEDDIQVIDIAVDGIEVCKKVNEIRPDIILMDVVMPKMDGIEATRRIRKDNPSTRVIMLSVYDRQKYVKSSMEAGASAYVVKGSSFDELVDAIRRTYKEQQSKIRATSTGE